MGEWLPGLVWGEQMAPEAARGGNDLSASRLKSRAGVVGIHGADSRGLLRSDRQTTMTLSGGEGSRCQDSRRFG